MADLTTLQLARRIADAVSLALRPAGPGPNRNSKDWLDPPTQAVLETLHASQSWFCRITDEGEDGVRYEPVQLPLWHPKRGARAEVTR